MKTFAISILAAAGTSLGSAQAAEPPRPTLQDPPICSTLTSKNVDSCKAVKRTDGSGISDIELNLTAAERPVQVGDYVLESESYNGTYIPPLVETAAGSTIRISLKDELPAPPDPGDHMKGHTNVHTHGLMVSPHNEKDLRGNGDNILLDLKAGDTFQYDIPIPLSLPPGTLDNKKAIRHPDGLYWYHPHLHGNAKVQVSGGMSGVISIGRARDLLVVEGDKNATAALRAKTDVKYLELKDIQMTTSVAPEDADGKSAGKWTGDNAPDYCGDIDHTHPDYKNGYCQQISGATHNLWLFSINGQRYPRIDIGAGRNHLWRIANLSATTTYLLELSDGKDALQFEVVSVDGVVSGASAPTNNSVAMPKRKLLLLMPAGRAEILVKNDGSNPGPDRTLVLRTRGVQTGPSGDDWPPVNLAEIHMEKTERDPKVVSVRALLPDSAGNVTPALKAAAAAVGVSHVPAGCSRSVLKPGEWRRITLAQTDTIFQIGSEITSAKATTSDQMKPVDFPMDPMDWENDHHVCVTLGHTEIWEIDNTAGELHNFHLHQTKFRLARKDELAKLGVKDLTVTDPTKQLEGLGVDFASESTGTGSIWHDTLPVPLAKDDKTPGKIFIVINFKAPEQLGRYVFHCHILEHEDKGMMAGIEVLRGRKEVSTW